MRRACLRRGLPPAQVDTRLIDRQHGGDIAHATVERVIDVRGRRRVAVGTVGQSRGRGKGKGRRRFRTAQHAITTKTSTTTAAHATAASASAAKSVRHAPNHKGAERLALRRRYRHEEHGERANQYLVRRRRL